jgi:hypothetical protein
MHITIISTTCEKWSRVQNRKRTPAIQTGTEIVGEKRRKKMGEKRKLLRKNKMAGDANEGWKGWT